MSKKKIDERLEVLKTQEEKIKLELSKESDEIKGKVKRIGKIALTAGIVAILGYWIFNAFAPEEEKSKKKKKKQSKGTWDRLATLATPYLNQFLNGVMSEEDQTSKEKEKADVNE